MFKSFFNSDRLLKLEFILNSICKIILGGALVFIALSVIEHFATCQGGI
jgi:hypothetical protein